MILLRVTIIYFSFNLSCFVSIVYSSALTNTTVLVEEGYLVGEVLQTVTGDVSYYSYKGIPYAKPPVGCLRFKAPQDPGKWTGVRNATEFGPVCPQTNPFTIVFDNGSENCLFLNVYSPCITPKLLSVMVYIHGGGFTFGSGNDDWYGPDFFVSNNVFLVTVNYRLGALGFLDLGNEEVPGNAALKDQVAALKWVQNNIVNFGGNPNSVTLLGESAGSASVALHMVSRISNGLFQRVILLSGVPSMDAFISFRTKDRAFTLGKSLGCETKDIDVLQSFLTNVTYDLLINISRNQTTILASEEKNYLYFKMAAFEPVIEKDFGQERLLVKDVFESLEAGDVNDVDVLFGTSLEESLIMKQFYVNESYIDAYIRYKELFVPSKILHNSTPNTILKLANMIIEHYFGNETVNLDNIARFVEYASAAYIYYDVYRYFYRWPKDNIYCYKFSAESSRNYFSNLTASYGLYGVSHVDILFNLFDPKSLNYNNNVLLAVSATAANLQGD